MRKARTCLYPSGWPKAEREALEAAIYSVGLFNSSNAAHWSPDTINRRTRSYGTFLHFAHSQGMLHTDVRPIQRASGPLLEDFLEHLEDHHAASGIAIILSGMIAILRVIDPGSDTSILAGIARHYERIALPIRDMRHLLVGASELYDAGIARMQRAAAAGCDRLAAVRYGDGLTIAMCAAAPVRLKNLQATRVGVHLTRASAGAYEWGFAPSETKNHKRISAQLPTSLEPFLDRWLHEVRPFLLQGQDHDAMWVTTRGEPMSRTTVYWRLCNATERELGVRIYPHAIRHIAATSIAVSMPESVRMIPFILNNDCRTAQEHYNLADELSASVQYLKVFEQRRRQAFSKKEQGPHTFYAGAEE